MPRAARGKNRKKSSAPLLSCNPTQAREAANTIQAAIRGSSVRKSVEGVLDNYAALCERTAAETGIPADYAWDEGIVPKVWRHVDSSVTPSPGAEETSLSDKENGSVGPKQTSPSVKAAAHNIASSTAQIELSIDEKEQVLLPLHAGGVSPVADRSGDQFRCSTGSDIPFYLSASGSLDSLKFPSAKVEVATSTSRDGLLEKGARTDVLDKTKRKQEIETELALLKKALADRIIHLQQGRS